MEFDKAALVLVDIQKDFCAGGALAVPEGDEIVAVVNRLLRQFGFVVATQDWHPANHCSFQEQGGPWPAHCVQKTRGADLHPGLDPHVIDVLIKKADDPAKEAYSDFEGHDARGRKFDEVLKERGIDTLYVAGLATDYCVKATVLDALKRGYKVSVIEDAIRAVNVQRGDGDRALKEMKKAGARLVESKKVLEK